MYVLGENVSDFSTSQVKNVLSSKNNIVIEGHLEIIQDNMFYNCTSLAEIELPTGIKRIFVSNFTKSVVTNL